MIPNIQVTQIRNTIIQGEKYTFRNIKTSSSNFDKLTKIQTKSKSRRPSKQKQIPRRQILED